MQNTTILNSINEAQLLGIFKAICIDYSDPIQKNKLRNILAYSSDEERTLSKIIERDYNKLLCEEERARMLSLVKAFLNKSEYRKSISVETKNNLLVLQDFKCEFCGKTISLNSHADHIVPFKYAGDELNDNLQMLCSDCNEKKKDSIDYQIRFLLKLV